MNLDLYNKNKEKFLKILEEYKTKEEKIKYLEDCEFNINMIDRWDEEESISMRVIWDLLKELKKEERKCNKKI